MMHIWYSITEINSIHSETHVVGRVKHNLSSPIISQLHFLKISKCSNDHASFPLLPNEYSCINPFGKAI